MSVNSLEQPQNNPKIDSDDVEVFCESAVQDRAGNGTSSKNKHFSGVGVLGGKTEGCGVLVVDFVDVLVQNAGMERLMG